MYRKIELFSKDGKIKIDEEKLQNLNMLYASNEELSLSEEEYFFSFLDYSRTGNNIRTNIHEFLPKCENYLFTQIYLIYNNNLDGQLEAQDAFGIIEQSRKIKDIYFLNDQYKHWLQVIRIGNHSDKILQYVSKETRNHLKNSHNYAITFRFGRFLKQKIEKAIIAHSKYLYLKVKSFYQELGQYEQTIHICGHEIVIDSFAYFHILFRHYARTAKEYQHDSSYHNDKNIDPENLPNHLIEILKIYFSHIICSSFNCRRIYIRINQIIYAIWFKQTERHTGGRKEPIIRLQTFYPVTLQRELDYVSALHEIEIGLIEPGSINIFI